MPFKHEANTEPSLAAVWKALLHVQQRFYSSGFMKTSQYVNL